MNALRVPFARRRGSTRRDLMAVLPGLCRIACVAVLLALPPGASRSAAATWPNQPSVNLPVTTAAPGAFGPQVAPDGSGGVIVAWIDGYNGAMQYDVYAQHVLGTGAVDPAWPVNGRAVCTAANSQGDAVIASDGAGGALIAWTDLRGTSQNIYAAHVLASGVLDPAWPVNGRLLSWQSYSQGYPMIVGDGAGGAIVTFEDYRTGYSSSDIYAQHVLATGAVDAAWPANGRALCTASSAQTSPQVVSDGAGGAIVVWQDSRGGNTDLYAAHVASSGVVDTAWTANGTAVCVTSGEQLYPVLAADGLGGVLIAWQDYRSGTSWDIYAQRVLASGKVDPGWSDVGRAVCTAANDQYPPAITSDGACGAIVAWSDNRAGSGNTRPYAQHAQAGGIMDPGWPTDGRILSSLGGVSNPSLLQDGLNGAYVAWLDARTGAVDLYMTHVLATGALDGAWPTNGRAFCTASSYQGTAQLASDGGGGVVAAWQDCRTNGDNPDIYAQRVARFGYLGTPEAEVTGVRDVPNDQGGRVRLAWNASWLDLAMDTNLAAYDVYRAVPAALAAAARRAGTLRAWRSGELPPLAGGGFVTFPEMAADYAWEYVSSVSPNHFASQYSVLASTAFDSVAGSNPKTAFLVLARNSTGTMFWPSRPDSGYSTDNLAPATPVALMGQYASGTTRLHWLPGTDPDLAGYRLHRGTSPDFTPAEHNLVAAPADTGYADAAGAPYIYKLAAVDVHGNRSGFASLLPTGTVGVGLSGEATFALVGACPNPSVSGRLAVSFSLDRATPATLELLDVTGRRVLVRDVGALGAGQHVATLDERVALAPGVYMLRLAQGARVRVTRVAVIR